MISIVVAIHPADISVVLNGSISLRLKNLPRKKPLNLGRDATYIRDIR
jgi:hypothetical protein